MAKSTGVGLAELEAAFAEAEDAVAAESPEPASSGAPAKAQAPTSEQPSAVEHEVDEDVGLLSILEENLNEDEDGEQRRPVDDDSPTHLVNGEYLTTQELINGYMRQSDYTRKTQELAEERDRLRSAETLYNAIQENPVETIRMLAQRFNMGQPLLAQPPQAGRPQEASVNIDELVAQKVQEILGSDPRIAEVQSLAATQAEEAQFSQIEQDFDVKLTAKDRELVKRHAAEKGTDDLRFVFSALMQEAQLRKARKDQLRKAASATGRRSDDGEQFVPKKEYEDFWEAARDTMKELGWE